jgi:chromosome partitioning protein
MQVLVIAQQKGGVGKTTSAVNIAAGLALRGRRTLVVDADPQGSLTLSLGVDPADADAVGADLGDALLSGGPLPYRPTEIPNLSLVAATRALADAEFLLAPRMGRERFLSRALQPLEPDFDFVVLDTPPSLGLLTINCLAAAQCLFVPVAPALLSQAGLRDLLRTVQEIQEGINPKLRLAGIFVTFADARTVAARRAEADLRDEMGPLVLTTTISRRIAHEYAAQAGLPAVVMEPTGAASKEYHELTEEVCRRVEGK